MAEFAMDCSVVLGGRNRSGLFAPMYERVGDNSDQKPSKDSNRPDQEFLQSAEGKARFWIDLVPIGHDFRTLCH
jgi:hypothetical protein